MRHFRQQKIRAIMLYQQFTVWQSFLSINMSEIIVKTNQRNV
ncbi:Uncharacterized protein YR821_0476 [Yersinia ruckeri]|nr:hypothetical protein yruck0001_33260 [Yersinia ruckeri ATCC 29473]QTD75408.1 Uncharacterized protein YR821_0476 [Yersinia ruckeri]